MQPRRDEPAGGLPEQCLQLQTNAHHSQRRRSKRATTSTPSTMLCAALFFAYVFSPLDSNCIRTNNGSRSLSWSSSMRKSQVVGVVVHAFSTPPLITSRNHNLRISRIINHPLLKVSASSTETATTTRQDLKQMTVKQLKSYIQDNDIQIPKGQSSSLKLKQQIVDFIWNYQTEVNGSGEDAAPAGIEMNHIVEETIANGANGDSNGEAVPVPVPPPLATNKRLTKRTSMGTGMPPLPQTTERVTVTRTNDERSNNHNGDSNNSPPYTLTPKDRMVLDVLDRYPPLHESILNACAQNGNMDNIVNEGITADNIGRCDFSALNYAVPMGLGEEDVRHPHHPMLANTTQSDMDVVFVGTASCSPGVTRGVSCTALRLNWRSGRVNERDGDINQPSRGEKKKAKKGTFVEERGPAGGTWLFDAGESTQLSIQKTTSIKPGKISKIFITHCHGDHSFGLPGLLCLTGTDRGRDDPPIEIYGPEGLRMWLRVAIRYSVSRVVPPYRVHELMDVPMAPEWEEGHRKNGRFYFQLKRDLEINGRYGEEGGGKGSGGRWGMQGLAGEDPASWISRAPMINLEMSKDFGEIEGGQDIYPQYDHPKATDGAPVWNVLEEEDVSVFAAPMSHGVPCVGYVVQEHDRPGRLQPEKVLPIIERNHQGLKDSGIRHPKKVMAIVKNLPVGGSYTFPDGTELKQEDVVEAPRKGRKVVVCGDTADCRALEGLAQNADVLIHEATNTFLPGVDKDGNLRLVTRDAKIHGHSTPFMAGDFAKKINAKKLCLNHFSARYKGDQSIDSMTIMTRMERQAMKASELPVDSVAAAWDFMVLPVARN